MRLNIKFIIPILFLLLNVRVLKSQLQPLKIGDKVPDISFTILNEPGKKFLLSDYKNKFVILDFWATYCGTCIDGMPKMDSLQRKYKDALQILLITEQPSKQISQFLQKRKQLTGLNSTVPVVCDDTVFSKLFTHEHFPHMVWIDQGGRFKFVTLSQEVNDSNIMAVINRLPVQLQNKNDVSLRIATYKPLFVNENGGNGEAILNYSALSKNIDGMPSVSGVFYHNGANRTYAVGLSQSIRSLFQIAFNDFENQYWVPDNRTILNVADTAPYVVYINRRELYENFYNYQLIMPSRRPVNQMLSIMQADLMKYFNLSAAMEKKNLTCMVLTATDSSQLHSAGGNKYDEWDMSAYKLTMRNVTMTDVKTRFIYNIFEMSHFPFVDETNFKGMLDIELKDITANNMASVNRALEKYHLKLILREQPINMLIISEKPEEVSASTGMPLKNLICR